MNIWCLTVGEPLPIDGDHARTLRTGMLIGRLLERGHKVTWWTSAFDHVRKRHRFRATTEVRVTDGLDVVCLSGVAYRRNVSLARLWNHHQVGQAFRTHAARRQLPDAIVCSFPLIDLAHEALALSKAHGIPLLVDVRDLWPDILVDLVPRPLRRAAAVALYPWFRKTREVFEGAAAIAAVSDGYLDWALAYAKRARTSADRVFPLAYEAPALAIGDDAQVVAQLRAAGIDITKKIALFIGTFGRTYDLSTVVAAARRLQDDPAGRAYQFVLCGDGDNAPQWRAEAAGLRNVTFPGWLQAPAISYLLRHSYLGLAAYEAGAPQGLPNKLFEYMAAGLPVVSSLRGEAETLLANHDCGLTYAARDAAALEQCLVRLLDGTLYDRLSGNSAEAFGNHYSAETVYEVYADFIENFGVLFRKDAGFATLPRAL